MHCKKIIMWPLSSTNWAFAVQTSQKAPDQQPLTATNSRMTASPGTARPAGPSPTSAPQAGCAAADLWPDRQQPTGPGHTRADTTRQTQRGLCSAVLCCFILTAVQGRLLAAEAHHPPRTICHLQLQPASLLQPHLHDPLCFIYQPGSAALLQCCQAAALHPREPKAAAKLQHSPDAILSMTQHHLHTAILPQCKQARNELFRPLNSYFRLLRYSRQLSQSALCKIVKSQPGALFF